MPGKGRGWLSPGGAGAREMREMSDEELAGLVLGSPVEGAHAKLRRAPGPAAHNPGAPLTTPFSSPDRPSRPHAAAAAAPPAQRCLRGGTDQPCAPELPSRGPADAARRQPDQGDNFRQIANLVRADAPRVPEAARARGFACLTAQRATGNLAGDEPQDELRNPKGPPGTDGVCCFPLKSASFRGLSRGMTRWACLGM
jgi:hypothetical protein